MPEEFQHGRAPDFEAEIIGERTRDKMRAARRKGKWIGGMPVLGLTPFKDRQMIVALGCDGSKTVLGIRSLHQERQGA